MQAIILAGGRGTRLAPYTTVFPKPLMPVGSAPILELLLRRLGRFGIKDVTLSVGHLAPLLVAYFGNGEQLGVSIKYCHESEPLGTAGPIRRVKDTKETFLVMNGDLLTDVDFSEIIRYHKQQDAIATVGLYRKEIRIDLGVIRLDGEQRLTAYEEKPVVEFHVSMGIYVMQKRAIDYIPDDHRFDLPELINAIRAANEKVVGYVHKGYWLDIGNPRDYEKAQQDVQEILGA